MIVFITGASHTGKTLLAQKLLEKYRYPYLSMDHLKMGLIRSGNTPLTPQDDDALTDYLWLIVREISKTAIENGQNLIIEGGYIPLDYVKDFTLDTLKHIRFYCLIMSEGYIKKRFADIKQHTDAIENRLNDDWFTQAQALAENVELLQKAKEYHIPYVLIDGKYQIDIDLHAS